MRLGSSAIGTILRITFARNASISSIASDILPNHLFSCETLWFMSEIMLSQETGVSFLIYLGLTCTIPGI